VLYPARPSYSIPLPSGRTLQLGPRCLVMAILNVTPDSFAEETRFETASAVEAALRMAADGADIIDIGGESTRPGAEPVSAGDEAARVLPVIRAVVRQTAVPVSIDTYKADIARAALAEGRVDRQRREWPAVRPGPGRRGRRSRSRPGGDAHPGAVESDVSRSRIQRRGGRGGG